MAALPPAPPKAGNRGAERRDDVDNREAREPGRRGDDWRSRPVAGKDCAGDADIAGNGGEGVRSGEEGSNTGASNIGSGGAGSDVAGA